MSSSRPLTFFAAAIVAALMAHVPREAAATDPHQHEVVPPSAPLSGESIYQLQAPLTTTDGKAHALADLRGRPVLVAMFYSSCQSVCPLLAFTMRRMEAALSEAERSRMQIVLVSFDPARDTPAALAAFAALHKLDTGRWWLARTPESSVRELAAVLGVRYREASPGVFSHSAVITLLDAEGRIVQRTTRLDALDAPFMDTVHTALAVH